MATTARTHCSTTLILMAGLILALASPVHAMVVDYVVSLNTGVLMGTSGFLDLQFNPGTIPGTPEAEAAISLFSGDAVLKNTGPTNGTGLVTGALPGDLVFGNGTPFNSFFQEVTFGSSTGFHVNFSGAFLTALSGSHSAFSVSLYDADGITPLLTTDASGALMIFDLAPGGEIASMIFNPSVVTVAAVPLPAAAVLFPTGLSLFAIVRRALHE
ncbi:MAG TPA: hypothetical protein DEA71_13645 [Nitrospira sp.]|nr:hypothetical protein [Nitrospira sp.]